MKIQFKADLSHQIEAVNAVVGVFKGQETFQSHFTVTQDEYLPQQLNLLGYNSDLGIGHKLDNLLSEKAYENTRTVQLKNGLAQVECDNAKLPSLDFSVEMETGTGKTYVYLRTVFELNQKYGLTKFIIVVPSIAIKEGVYKSLQITEQHFRQQYKNVQYDYFVYDSSKREQVRNFATNDYIQIMVINIDAFSKSFTDPSKETTANLIHRSDDRLNGMKPIKFIQDVRPVVIIDEPQSVVSTQNRKDAIANLKPLCTFRYSATMKEAPNLLYKLDSIDAYERKLVKQIEVASLSVENGHNHAYIKLLSVDNKKSPITAKIEIDAQTRTGKLQPRKVITVKSGSDLFELSGGRTLYEGFVINDIYCAEGHEYIDFTSRDEILRLGQAIGEVDQDAYKRIQVAKTIEEHLEKELKFHHKITTGHDKLDHSKVLSQKGIKVLSLFFIDKVANYRGYTKDGELVAGKFALWFEEEFAKQVSKPKYQVLYPTLWHQENGQWVVNPVALKELTQSVHDGYFAQDKKKDALGQPQFAESKISAKGEGGKTAADESAYNLIMRDKEKLLSMDTPLRFIFSHSALKEGWDNPNVFQICTLNETNSVTKKRQEIGRGLRLAVDQSGERAPYGFEVNTLTVMANESYESFVSALQKEIEEEEGIKFGVVEKHQFANITVEDEFGQKSYLGTKASLAIHQHLCAQGYIDSKGKIQEALKVAIRDEVVDLPENMQAYSSVIIATLKKFTKGLNVKKQEERKQVSLRKDDSGKQIVLGDDFKALWDRIKYKTTYRVNFSENALVDSCIAEIRANVAVASAKFQYKKVEVAVTEAGLETSSETTKTEYYQNRNFQLPDIVTYLTDQTHLTRQTVIDILLGLGDKLEAFKNNPQRFIELTAEVIRKHMRIAIVNGIKYSRIGDDAFYAQELFQEDELSGYLKDMVKSEKSVYDYVLCDSETESTFAKRLEVANEVKLFAKLPPWFKINTPLGGYNPDWTVLIDKNDGTGEHLYFVVETKSSMLSDDLRASEKAKIQCGIEHFSALSKDEEGKEIPNSAKFVKADSFDTFTTHLA